jgi:hypothetical protein
VSGRTPSSSSSEVSLRSSHGADDPDARRRAGSTCFARAGRKGSCVRRAAVVGAELPAGYFPEEREAVVIERIRSDPDLRDELYRRVTTKHVDS